MDDSEILSTFRGVVFDPCNENTIGIIIETLIKPKSDIDIRIKSKKPIDSLSSAKKEGLLFKSYIYEVSGIKTADLKLLLMKEYENVSSITYIIEKDINITMLQKRNVMKDSSSISTKIFELDFAAYDNDLKNEILKIVWTNFQDSAIKAGIMQK